MKNKSLLSIEKNTIEWEKNALLKKVKFSSKILFKQRIINLLQKVDLDEKRWKIINLKIYKNVLRPKNMLKKLGQWKT